MSQQSGDEPKGYYRQYESPAEVWAAAPEEIRTAGYMGVLLAMSWPQLIWEEEEE